jgi:hypothetical protein
MKHRTASPDASPPDNCRTGLTARPGPHLRTPTVLPGKRAIRLLGDTKPDAGALGAPRGGSSDALGHISDVAKWLVRIWPARYVSPSSRLGMHPPLPGGLDRNLRVPKVVPRGRASPLYDQPCRKLALVVMRGGRRRPEAGEPRLDFCRIPGKTWQSSGGRSSEPAGPPPGRTRETHPAGAPPEAGGRANRAWVFAGFRAKPGKGPRTRARRRSFAPQLPPASGPNQGVLAVQRGVSGPLRSQRDNGCGAPANSGVFGPGAGIQTAKKLAQLCHSQAPGATRCPSLAYSERRSFEARHSVTTGKLHPAFSPFREYGCRRPSRPRTSGGAIS